MMDFLMILVQGLSTALGLEWRNIDDGAKLTAVIDLGLGVIGIWLGTLGWIIARRQARLSELQQEVLLNEHGRNTEIEVVLLNTPSDAVVVSVKNLGYSPLKITSWLLVFPIDYVGLRVYESARGAYCEVGAGIIGRPRGSQIQWSNRESGGKTLYVR